MVITPFGFGIWKEIIMSSEVTGGTYEGTGAAINIELGWIPDFVQVWNVEDGDATWTWFYGFGAGDAFATANHDTAQQSLITSNGIDAYTGSATPGSEAAPGFTVGTALSESGKTFRYRAERWSAAG